MCSGLLSSQFQADYQFLEVVRRDVYRGLLVPVLSFSIFFNFHVFSNRMHNSFNPVCSEHSTLVSRKLSEITHNLLVSSCCQIVLCCNAEQELQGVEKNGDSQEIESNQSSADQ